MDQGPTQAVLVAAALGAALDPDVVPVRQEHAAAEVGVGLAIILLIYRNRRSIDLDTLDAVGAVLDEHGPIAAMVVQMAISRSPLRRSGTRLPASSRPVTMVTPVANWPSAFLKSRGSKSGASGVLDSAAMA